MPGPSPFPRSNASPSEVSNHDAAPHAATITSCLATIDAELAATTAGESEEPSKPKTLPRHATRTRAKPPPPPTKGRRRFRTSRASTLPRQASETPLEPVVPRSDKKQHSIEALSRSKRSFLGLLTTHYSRKIPGDRSTTACFRDHTAPSPWFPKTLTSRQPGRVMSRASPRDAVWSDKAPHPLGDFSGPCIPGRYQGYLVLAGTQASDRWCSGTLASTRFWPIGALAFPHPGPRFRANMPWANMPYLGHDAFLRREYAFIMERRESAIAPPLLCG